LGQRHLNQSHNGTRDRQFDLKEQQRRLVEDESRANAEVAEGERRYVMLYCLFGHLHLLFSRLKQLDDDSYRRLQNLAQYDPDCAAVINWLRANKHRFRMEIIEPATVSLTVPNKNYVHAVEACFNITQLKVSPFNPFPGETVVVQIRHRHLSPNATMIIGCLTGLSLIHQKLWERRPV